MNFEGLVRERKGLIVMIFDYCLCTAVSQISPEIYSLRLRKCLYARIIGIRSVKKILILFLTTIRSSSY